MSTPDKKNRQLLYIIIGAVLATVFGTFWPEVAVKTGVLGDLFLNALKMMVLPLIATSIIVGITNLGDTRTLGSIGIKALLYYMATTGIAVVLGLIVVNVIQPGAGGAAFVTELPEAIQSKKPFSLLDTIVGMIHPNLVKAAAEFKILPIIFASILFGTAIVSLKEKGRPLVDFVTALNESVMKIVLWIMVVAPIGIFGLIAHRLGVTGGGAAVFDLVAQLGKYCAAVVIGLGVHGFVFLPLILFLLAKRNPFAYFIHLAKALVTAFATASSSATLPVTLECTTIEAKVSNRTASVVLPLGATVNMDGTALYEAVAALFIAQSYGISLGMGEQVTVVLTATLASIGAAGIPEAGLVTMILVLQSVGLPLEGIGMILAVDWILDRCRTTVNVWGDAVGSAVIDASELRSKKTPV